MPASFDIGERIIRLSCTVFVRFQRAYDIIRENWLRCLGSVETSQKTSTRLSMLATLEFKLEDTSKTAIETIRVLLRRRIE